MRRLALCLVVTVSGPLLAQEVDRNQVVASAGGHNLTINDLTMALAMAWFLTTEMPADADIKALAEALVGEFNAQPQAFRQGADLVAQLLMQAKRYQNPLEVGLYRMHVMNVIWAAVEKVLPADRGALLNYIFERNPVLAYDRENQMVFTLADAMGAMRYLMFISGNTDPTAEQLAQLKPMIQQIAANYVAMSVQEKQQLALAGLMWQVVGAQWARLTPEQKQQFLAQMQQAQQQSAQPQAPPTPQQNYQNMDMDTYRAMSRLSQMQHVATMNVIENIGGTGNYWEIVRDPYY